MLRKLYPRSVYDVMAAIACFGVLAGGTAYAANTIRTGDIVDNEVTSPDVRDDTLGFGGLAARDLGPGSVGTSEIAPFATNDVDIATSAINSRHINNGTLNDEDVGQSTFVNFEADIGVVPAQGCVKDQITGINASGDHLLLTPNNNDSRGSLTYQVYYVLGQEWAWLETCNPGTVALNDENTHFNLLVFDAQ